VPAAVRARKEALAEVLRFTMMLAAMLQLVRLLEARTELLPARSEHLFLFSRLEQYDEFDCRKI
jgi:uncharacterized protein YcaQ